MKYKNSGKNTKLKLILVVLLCLIFITGILRFNFRIPSEIKQFNRDGVVFNFDDYNDDLFIKNWYFNQLNENEKRIYKTFYHHSSNFDDSFYFMYSFNASELDRAHTAFSLDYPQFYWWDQYTVKTFNITSIFQTYTYYQVISDVSNSEQIQLESIKIKEVANKIVQECSNLEKNYLEYQKVFYSSISYDEFVSKYFELYYVLNVHDFLINNTDYNKTSIQNQDLRSVLLHGESVCAGYSESFQYLLNLQNIPCISIIGDSIRKDEQGTIIKEPHEWNIVTIQDNKYYVDITWDDSNDELSYAYCLTNNKTFSQSHIPYDKFDEIKVEDNYDLKYYQALKLLQEDDAIKDFKSGLKENNNFKHYKNINYYAKNDESFELLKDWINSDAFGNYLLETYSCHHINYSYVFDDTTSIISINILQTN